MRRVVITGLGLVNPLGAGVNYSWDRLLNGKSGIMGIKHFDVSDLKTKIAGLIPMFDKTQQGNGYEDVSGLYNPDKIMLPKAQRKLGEFMVNVVAAAEEAVQDAGWLPQTEEEKCRTGVVVGSGLGGFNEIAKAACAIQELQSLRRLSPFFLTNSLINLAAGQISIRYDLRGPNESVSSAFATGAHVIISAMKMIGLGDADMVVAGATEVAVSRIALAGFSAMHILSSHYNHYPETACRPWDRGRDGTVIGDGAGVLILEDYEHAKKRGAHIYAELTGYGMSGDAYHMTTPLEDGSGGLRAMQMALKKSRRNPEDIGYLNAHATGTIVGDRAEFQAVKRLFSAKNTLSMSSTKGATGHLLGAAGLVEAIYTIKALETGLLPPTLNLDDVDEACGGIDLIPKISREKSFQAALSNSFGFGGVNASLIFEKV